MFFPGVVDGHDIRVIQPAGGLRLTEKAFHDLSDLGRLKFLGNGEGFDGHDPVDFGIAPEINGAHGAPAQLFFKLITPQGGLLVHAVQNDRPVGRGGL